MWTIRPAEPSDRKFLEDMLYEAATWRGQGGDRGTVLEDPHIARYLSGWGRPGDTALIATDEGGQAVGAAWFRFFTSDEAGYGFLDETIPDLSMGVAQSWRGQGVGTELMSALVAAARQQGVHELSLSVEPDNPALRLYERSGFRAVSENDGALTMRLDLDPTDAREEPRP